MKCPDCEIAIPLPEELHVGQIIDCENCGAELEIKSTEPLEFELIEDEK